MNPPCLNCGKGNDRFPAHYCLRCYAKALAKYRKHAVAEILTLKMELWIAKCELDRALRLIPQRKREQFQTEGEPR